MLTEQLPDVSIRKLIEMAWVKSFQADSLLHALYLNKDTWWLSWILASKL
jgi:hypothetical protein